MRETEILAPIAADLTTQAFTGTAAEKDLAALRGKSVIFIADEDCYILFGAATGFSAVTSTTGIFLAAGTAHRRKVKHRSRFLSVIRKTTSGTLQMHATISNVPDREPAA